MRLERTSIRRVIGGPWLAAALLLAAWGVGGQSADVPIESGAPLLEDRQLLRQARALREAGKLTDEPTVRQWLRRPSARAFALTTVATDPLPPWRLYQRARAAFVRVGWYGLCDSCSEWHLSLGAGYAIATNGIVATCHHVLGDPSELSEAWLLAVTADGRVVPVTGVCAADEELDTAIIQVAAPGLEPLALNPEVRPGDAAYCFSDPLDARGYFSAGMVNRFYWSGARPGNLRTLAGLAKLRFNVSTDWAPGSSGAAVLDACGNVIGHVSTITPLSEFYPSVVADAAPVAEAAAGVPDAPSVGLDAQEVEDLLYDATPLITLHEAVPARGVLKLAAGAQPPPARGD